MIRPNTKDAADFSPTGIGTFPCLITAAEPGISKSNNDVLRVTVIIETSKGPSARTYSLNIDGKGAFKFDELLRSVGMSDDADRFKKGEAAEFDEQSLVGLKLKISIVEKLNDFNGEKREDLGRFLPL